MRVGGRCSPALERPEKGAVAIVIALVMCFMIIPLAGLAVDLGTQRVARSDAQTVADLVALNMARSLSSGTTPTDALAAQSEGSMSGIVGTTPTVHVYSGYLSPTATFISDQRLGCNGTSPYNSYFTAPPSGQSANAVLVTASGRVSFSIMGGGGSVCRSAIAAAATAACYDVGSYAAMASTSSSPLLNPVFQQIAQQTGAFSNGATVSAISYKGLATSQVDLGLIATSLGVGSVNALATSTVKVHDLYVAALNAMVAPRNQTNVTAMNSLIATVSPTATINMGSILQVGSGTGSLTSATMNLFDLVGGSLALINGTNVASVNVGTGTLSGVANANAQVHLIQGPHHFCGTPGSSATTATSPGLTQQLGVTMTAQVNPINQSITVPAISGLSSGTTATVALPNNLNTTVSVAPTSTTLTSVQCTAAKGINLNVSNGLATVTLSTYLSNIVVNTNLLNLTILGIPVAQLNAKISVNTSVTVTATVSPSGVIQFSINVPNQAFDTFYPTSNSGASLGIPQLSSPSIQAQSNATIVGVISAGSTISLNATQQNQLLNAIVTSVLTPMFDATNSSSFVSTVVNPILALLGANVGGSEIDLSSKPAPGCGNPALKG